MGPRQRPRMEHFSKLTANPNDVNKKMTFTGLFYLSVHGHLARVATSICHLQKRNGVQVDPG